MNQPKIPTEECPHYHSFTCSKVTKCPSVCSRFVVFERFFHDEKEEDHDRTDAERETI